MGIGIILGLIFERPIISIKLLKHELHIISNAQGLHGHEGEDARQVTDLSGSKGCSAGTTDEQVHGDK